MTQLIDLQDRVGGGWVGVIGALHFDLVQRWPDYTVVSVKEKWGGLTVRLPDSMPEEAHQLAGMAYRVSRRMCESCGQPARPRFRPGTDRGWMKTCCDDCWPDQRPWRRFGEAQDQDPG